MPITADIDGNAVEIQRESMNIPKCIEERSTASFNIVDIDGSTTISRGMPVTIYDPDLNTLFAGFIDTPGKARIGPTGLRLLHDVVCMDNHYLADKRLVVKSYIDKTLEFIVEDILTDYLIPEGVAEGLIQTGPIIGEAIFNYVSVAEAFDALKEYSGYIWFIDNSKDLYFVDRTTYTAPWDLDNSTYRPIKGSVHLNTGNTMYRNQQYIRGGTGLTALQTEDQIGDANVQSFAMGYPVSQEPTITEDAAPKTVGIKGIDTGKDYYWNKGDNIVTATVAPGNGVVVQVQYYGEYPLIVLAKNVAAQAARAAIEGSGTGIVENILTEMQHDTADAMRESAKAKLVQYCQDAEKFIYQTHYAGLEPGQIQAITFAPFGFAAHDMLITSVTVTANGDLILYDIECITGPVMGSWTKFFASLITRQDRAIRLGEGKLLVLLHQAESLSFLESTALHSDAFPPDVSRWIALPPAQGAGHHVRHEALDLSEATDITPTGTEYYLWC